MKASLVRSVFALIILAMCLGGCGGGTSGTGVTSFEGSAKLAVTNEPFIGSVIAQSRAGLAQTETAEDGSFSLLLGTEDEELVTFKFVSGSQESLVEIVAPSGDDNSVSLVVEVDTDRGTATVVSRRDSSEDRDPVNSDDTDSSSDGESRGDSSDRDRDEGSSSRGDGDSDSRGDRGDSNPDREDGVQRPGGSGGEGSDTDGSDSEDTVELPSR